MKKNINKQGRNAKRREVLVPTGSLWSTKEKRECCLMETNRAHGLSEKAIPSWHTKITSHVDGNGPLSAVAPRGQVIKAAK